jgi:hypothetical protein
MGSGETSPTMVTVHKSLVARLGPGSHRAVLLDTPYAFQENAADISARAQAYFARSVGLQVDVADEPASIRGYDWVFSGPGSPSYALRRWRGGPVAEALRDRIAGGPGITVIASAAAAAMGHWALPVYEIYKVGADPYWLDGLDLLGVLGLDVAVIPHYDNAEGGTHDTRFCYLGERRLSVLERALPPQAAVLGVDEHTALIVDLADGRADVLGRGGATIRKAGRSTVLPSGSSLTLADLRLLARTGTAASPDRLAPRSGETTQGPPTAAQAGEPALSLPESTDDAEGRFAAAEREGSGPAMVAAILDLEAAIEAWATDTDENDNADRARAVLRGLVARLGQAADQGLADPADRLRPAVEPLLRLRDELRADRLYAASDAIRDALARAGVEVRDTADGTRWEVTA